MPQGLPPDGPDPFANTQTPAGPDPFADMQLTLDPAQQGSAGGTFARGAARGILPAAGGFAGAGAGAELLGSAGFMAGGPVGGAVGAFVGGVGGAFAGGAAVNAAQQAIMDRLPDSIQHFFGQSREQQARDEMEHPYAAFAGEMAPNLLGMSPRALTGATPETATALRRLMSNPWTARAFSGAFMGGMEAGQEALETGDTDWTKIGISTVAGLAFANTNQIGHRLSELGASPVRRIAASIGMKPFITSPEVEQQLKDQQWKDLLADHDKLMTSFNEGVMEPAIVKAGLTSKDLALVRQAAVIGEGEDGFFNLTNPTVEDLDARSTAAGQRATGIAEPLDTVHDIARKVAPDVFRQYDALKANYDDYREQLTRMREARAEDAQPRIQEILEKVNGVEDRLTRKKAGELQALRLSLTADNAQMSAVRQAMVSASNELLRLGPQVREAYQTADLWQQAGAQLAEKPEPIVLGPTEKKESLWGTEGLDVLPPEFLTEHIPGDVLVAAKAGDPTAMEKIKQIAKKFGQSISVKPETAVRPVEEVLPEAKSLQEQAAQRYIAAGRPEAEAKAVGAIEAAHYTAWAGLFGMTPKEFFEKNAVRVAGTGEKVTENPSHNQEVYHGSPHEFENFDLKKIGTGEGEHSYGWGLYFAAKKAIAEHYKSTLSPTVAAFERDGKTYSSVAVAENLEDFVFNKFPNASIHDVRNGVHWALMEAQGHTVPALSGEPLKIFKASAEKLKSYQLKAKSGKLYRVDIPDDVSPNGGSNYLEWGKTPEQQSGSAESAVRKLAAEHEIDLSKLGSAAAFYAELGKKLSPEGSQEARAKAASLALRDEGVAGIKYLDNASRYAEGEAAEQTHNYVLFNDQHAKIKSYEQILRGRITFADDHATMQLFKSADASTAVHELGHKFLQELVDLSAHENAPQQLKGMLKDTLNWLKLDDASLLDNSLTHADKATQAKLRQAATKAHEKFARGFEQYLLEGHAPSRELVGVFDQFKEWLGRIYQTLRGLGQPINEDIKKVFDQMLSTNPERAVIAKERQSRPTLADIHKTDAILTPDHQAARTAESVRSEIDTVAAKNPEIQNALHAGTSYEAERLAQEAEQSKANTANDKKSGDAGAGEGSGGEPGSRDESVGEGGKPSAKPNGQSDERTGTAGGPEPAIHNDGEQRARRATATGDQNAPNGIVNPNAEFIRDKDGRLKGTGLRLDLLDLSGGVKAFIESKVANRPDLLDARNNPEAYMRAVEIQAVQELLAKAGTEAARLSEQMTEAKTLKQQMQIVADYMKWGKILDETLRRRDEIRGEWHRTGMALQKLKGLSAEEIVRSAEKLTGKSFDQMVDAIKLAGELENPEQVAKNAIDVLTAKWEKVKNAAVFLWLNSILSGPITHTAYIVGTHFTQVFKATVTSTAQAALSHVLGREGADKIYFGEAGAQLASIYTSIPEAIPAVWKALKTGVPERLFGENGTILKPGEKPPMFPTALENPLKDLGVPNVIANVLAAPMHSINAIHTFNKMIGYNMELARLAYRQAAAEGLRGEAFTKRYVELKSSPTEEMAIAAAFEGNKIALNERAKWGTITQRIAQISNQNVLAKILVPFAQVEMNIVQQGLFEHTPIGLVVKGDAQEAAFGGKGKLEQDLAIGKMVAGSLLGIGVVGLAAQGNITGGCTEEERQAWALSGKQPYAIKINGMWQPYKKILGYMAKPVMLAADLFQLAEHMHENDVKETVAEIGRMFGELAVDDTWMGSIANFVEAASHPDTRGHRYLYNMVASLLPYSSFLSQISHLQASDPYLRKMNSLREAVQAKIPGYSQGLLPKRDIFGQEMPNRTMVTPSKETNDPVIKELVNLEAVPHLPAKALNGVELTPQQYDDYTRISGRLARIQLDKFINSPGWSLRKEYVRKDIISKIFANSHKAAANTVIVESRGTNNDIFQLSLQAKKDELEK